MPAPPYRLKLLRIHKQKSILIIFFPHLKKKISKQHAQGLKISRTEIQFFQYLTSEYGSDIF